MTPDTTNALQAPDAATWSLAAGHARRLNIGPGARWLRVCAGRLWITRMQAGSAERQLEDVWLQAGDSLAVESGEQLLVEAWPAARFQLLVPPQACRTNWRTNGRTTLGRISGWFSWAKPQPA